MSPFMGGKKAYFASLSFGDMTADISSVAPPKGETVRGEWVWWISLFLVAALVWCAAYNRWSLEAWITPVSYTGDSWAIMATAKTLAAGEMLPILPKYPSSLGAPFVANWNDYPSGEEGLFVWYAIFVRLFGIFLGSNLTLLSAHLLAAGSFYFVCRALGYAKIWSFAGAILFSMSRFAFARCLWHLVLTFYWHVPLGLLVIWWCLSTNVSADRRKRILCVLIAVLHGIQYVYFTGMFCQFLVIAALLCLIRRDGWGRVLFPLYLVGAIVVTVVIMNADTFYYSILNGPNPAAVHRDYLSLEMLALRPVELFLPTLHHIDWLQNKAHQAYYSQTMFQQGENSSPYLGIVAIGALAYLLWVCLRSIARADTKSIPLTTWGIVWIFAFSILGGANGLAGVFGFILFRGANRYSLVILALVLLFLVRELTRLTRGWRARTVWVSAAVLLSIGLWDQIPPAPSLAEIRTVHAQVASDGRITSSLEATLPRGAMVFELPFAGYPEVGPIEKMLDYEHFRPYLQSRFLRFSYGSDKGRTRDRWQSEQFHFGTSNAINNLEKYGFAALLINRNGYRDRAEALIADLRASGRSEILAKSDDFLCIALHPSGDQLLPPEFDQSWYAAEGSATDRWRWSMGNAKLILYNGESRPRNVRLTFGLGCLEPRKLEVYAGTARIYGASLDPAQPVNSVEMNLSLQPGKNELIFRSDRPAKFPGNGDPRKLAFSVKNFTIAN
jgi:phosphoglycerol transferase